MKNQWKIVDDYIDLELRKERSHDDSLGLIFNFKPLHFFFFFFKMILRHLTDRKVRMLFLLEKCKNPNACKNIKKFIHDLEESPLCNRF